MSGRYHDRPASRHRAEEYDERSRRHTRSSRHDPQTDDRRSDRHHSHHHSHSRSYSHKSARPRRRWPPQPSAEEEVVALRNELGGLRWRQGDGVPERGCIDQDPIIIDVVPASLAFAAEHARQQLNARTAARQGAPTPPTSDDEKAGRGRRHGATLETGFLPETRREPSPYHYPAAAPQQATSYGTSPSPNSITPPSSSAGRQPAAAAPKPRIDSVPIPQRPGYRPTTQSPLTSSALLDDPHNGIRSPIGSGRIPEPLTGRPTFVAEPESISGTQDLPLRPPSSRRPHLSDDHRRHTDSYMDVSREAIVDSIRKPAPLKVATLVREASGQHAPASSPRTPAGKTSARNSPRESLEGASGYPPSPPRSPRLSQDRSRDSLNPSKRRSMQSSAEGSYASSPSASPRLSPALPASPAGWQNAFDRNKARNDQPPARQASGQRVNDLKQTHTQAPPSISRAESLPYPVNDFLTAMPEERDHQYLPDGLRQVSPSPMLLRVLPGAAANQSLDSSTSTPRPGLAKHHSFADPTASKLPVPPRPPQPSRSPRRESFNAVKKPASALAPAPPTALPPCPRAQYESGFTDWFTLSDCPDLDVCPHCVHEVFEKTYHGQFFRPAPRTPQRASAKFKCDFSNPWMRLAWLLTLQRGIPDLTLLKRVHQHLQTAKPCPDTEEASHEWYGILDDSTMRSMRGFHICSTDVGTILVLLPDLLGFFTKYPNRSSSATHSNYDQSARLCSFRSSQNNRFPLFLDSLISVYESGIRTEAGWPDMRPFTRLVKRKVALDDCPRDNILQGEKWYFIPSLPEFTVCDDCHDDLISPLMSSDSDLAMRFNRHKTFLPLSGSDRSPRDSMHSLTDVAKEASCCLYSPRMRKVFRRAVEDNDLKYLTRKARERREVEARLQRLAQPLIGRLRDIDDALGRYGGRKGWEREVGKLEEERRGLGERLRGFREEWLDYE